MYLHTSADWCASPANSRKIIFIYSILFSYLRTSADWWASPVNSRAKISPRACAWAQKRASSSWHKKKGSWHKLKKKARMRLGTPEVATNSQKFSALLYFLHKIHYAEDFWDLAATCCWAMRLAKTKTCWAMRLAGRSSRPVIPNRHSDKSRRILASHKTSNIYILII